MLQSCLHIHPQLSTKTETMYCQRIQPYFKKIQSTLLKNDPYIFITLSAIFIIGIYLRFWRINDVSLWIDEGFSILAAKGILAHGIPKLPSGELYNRDYFFTYPLAIFIGFFGFDPFNPWSARLLSSILGIGSIWLIYGIGQRVFTSPWVGVLASFFTAISTWEIAWSLQARMYMELQFFFLLILLLVFSYLNTNKNSYLALIAIFTVAAFFTHKLGIVITALLATIFILLYCTHAIQTIAKTPVKYSRLKYLLQQDFNYVKKLPLYIQLTLIITICVLVYLAWNIVNNQLIILAPIPLNFQQFMWQQYALLLIISAIGTVLALLILPHKNRILTLALAYLIPFEIIAIFVSRQEFRYIFFFFPILFLLASYAIIEGPKLLLKNFAFANYAFVVSILLTATLLFLAPEHTFSLDQNTIYLEKGVPQPNFSDAYSYIAQNIEPEDIIISPLSWMDQLYLDQADAWIMISLTAQARDTKYIEENGVYYDWYLGTPAITTVDELTSLMTTQHGYIILDDFGVHGRVSEDMLLEIKQHSNLVWSDDQGKWRRIWVHEF